MADSLAHGWSKYSNDGCRCEVCTSDWARKARNRRRKRYASTKANGLPPTGAHGSSAYTNWGCRCEVCTTANRETWARARGAA